MKKARIEFISGGMVTSPRGFCAGATYAGIKKRAKYNLDLGILFSEAPCATAAMFTTNKVKSASVMLNQERLKNG
ncbi:MAG: bifunctional ornithine acetyltransferase/N-acetylglutamate synthase, partial [Dehalococcoidales bacterium]|nr:bifunctional ornithine acetyltransferase/N-acetylglutamate synthase [Dehalococcoidales bacterium]